MAEMKIKKNRKKCYLKEEVLPLRTIGTPVSPIIVMKIKKNAQKACHN